MRRGGRAVTCAAITAVAAAATAAPALADGGRTAWPGSAPLAGAWSGTATSTTKADFTFPMRATVSVASTGRPTGRVDLGAPVNCAGRWVPVSGSGRVTTFTEDITSEVPGGQCINDGVVRLSPASGGRLRYVWSKGDAGSVAYLDPVGISGAWSGTVRQSGLPPIPARVRVVGVSSGQMHGVSRYGASLDCTGHLEPLGKGTQSRAVVRETIVRGAGPDCVGVGTITLALRSADRLAYRWEGGGDVSTGILRRAN